MTIVFRSFQHTFKSELQDVVNSKWTAQEAEIHNLLGALFFNLNDFVESAQHLQLSLEQYRTLGKDYQYYQAAPLLNIGRWFYWLEDYGCAKLFYKACLELSALSTS